MTTSNRHPSVVLFVDLGHSVPVAQKDSAQDPSAIKYFVRISSEIAASFDGQLAAHQGSYLLITLNTVKQALHAAKMIADEWKEYSSSPHFDKNLIAPRQAIHVGEIRIDAQGMAIGADANIAQRISMAAVPGGVALSEAAYSAVQSLLQETEKAITEMDLPAVAARYTICLLPSIEPSLYPLKHATVAPAIEEDFAIIKLKNSTPEKFSATDTILIALGVAVFLDFALANIYMRLHGVDLNSSILFLSNLWMLLLNIVVIGGVVQWLLRSALQIKVKALSGVDALIASVAGKSAGVKIKTEVVVNKKGVKWLKLMSGKTEIRLSGNEIVLTGHWSKVRRIKKLLKHHKV